MSEPSSLVACVHMTEPQFQAWMSSVPAPTSAYDDWLVWLDTRRYAGKTYTLTDVYEWKHRESISTVAEYLRMLTTPAYTAQPFGSLSQYDAVTQQWTLAIALYSENYQEFTRDLSVLRAIIQYKDLPDTDDFILIFNHFWGDNHVKACLLLQNGESRFVEPAPAELVTRAGHLLDSMIPPQPPNL